jgi:hypothetical protein
MLARIRTEEIVNEVIDRIHARRRALERRIRPATTSSFHSAAAQHSAAGQYGHARNTTVSGADG